MGRAFLILGLVFLVIGAFLTWGGKIPLLSSLGRLPGDVRIERPGFRLYFPITSAILVSLALTVLLRLFGKK